MRSFLSSGWASRRIQSDILAYILPSFHFRDIGFIFPFTSIIPLSTENLNPLPYWTDPDLTLAVLCLDYEPEHGIYTQPTPTITPPPPAATTATHECWYLIARQRYGTSPHVQSSIDIGELSCSY